MRREPRHALLAALGCGFGAALTYLAAFHVHAAGWLDGAALEGFTGLRGGLVSWLADTTTGLADPLPFACFVAALVLLALARERPRLAVLAVAVPIVAELLTQRLKPLLAGTRVQEFLGAGQVDRASWPSGHTTAAMSLALCLVVVAPPRLRPLAATVGGLMTISVVFGLLVLGWHYPSDALGGIFVAAGTTLTGLAGVWVADRRWPAGSGRAVAGEAVTQLRDVLAPPLAAGLALLALTAFAVLARLDAAVAYAQAHTVFVAVAAALATLALATAAAFAALLRR